jgi:argininosuccinate lyase
MAPTRSWKRSTSRSTSIAHLYAQDIAASKAHAAMLAAQGIITADDARHIAAV